MKANRCTTSRSNGACTSDGKSGNGSADKEIDYKMIGPTMSMKQ